MEGKFIVLTLSLALRVVLSEDEKPAALRPMLKVPGHGGQNRADLDDHEASKSESILKTYTPSPSSAGNRWIQSR